ncbi:hypothetical protein FYK55_02090 [Roseiconus nitratireducens]|uniref:Secreted protein n=1 Tax=Roseiconus nitratireducens TaxID=2605748 RepID=A0A5M6DP45_9BACT|nr:hypothetical protein [Roseiconus nitratireducens]KAA5547215.1 hypothetical protein FYK55_02090 [Roseiconus nitratireducens]
MYRTINLKTLTAGCLHTAVLCLCLSPLSGCAESEPEVGASTNDIQSYLAENPDALEQPEDQPTDESATFEAGAGDTE